MSQQLASDRLRTLQGDEQIILCDEHSEVALPIESLFEDGKLSIHPSIADKGYFDVSYRRGELVLRSRGIVGLFPITSRVILHVRPRTAIASLAWMAWRAGSPGIPLPGLIRGYLDAHSHDDPEVFIIRSFSRVLRTLSDRGLLKEYVEQESTEYRGRIDISKSVRNAYAKGIKQRIVTRKTNLTVDTKVNRSIKFTALLLIDRLQKSQNRYASEVVSEMKVSLAAFGAVRGDLITRSEIAKSTLRHIRSTELGNDAYVEALWLCHIISNGRAVSIESFGNPKFSSILFDTASVFEDYARQLCADLVTDYRVLDGNTFNLRLFEAGQKFPIKPDIYFMKGEAIVAIADAKYKPRISEQDRYELLAYCHATGCKHACFIVPKMESVGMTTHLGRTIEGVNLWIIALDLGRIDMATEERDFIKRLRRAVRLDEPQNS